MESITLFYQRISHKRQRRVNRSQAGAAALSLFLGLMDTQGIFENRLIIFPIFIGILIIVNVVLALKYDRLHAKMSHRFEVLLFRINGTALGATGLLCHLNGGRLVPYAYYALALVFIFYFPLFLPKLKDRRIILLNKWGLTVSRAVMKPRRIPWSVISDIQYSKFSLKIIIRAHRSKSFHLCRDQQIDLEQMNQQIQSWRNAATEAEDS